MSPVAVKLLLLHPLPLDGSIFGEELRGLGAACIAPTLYDAGDSIDAWARAALDAAGDGPLVVVGNSIGGSCAIEVARLAPDRVRALVLCGAKAGHRPDPALRDEALDLLATGNVRPAWDRYWRPLFGPGAAPSIIERAWQCASAIGVHGLANGVRAFHGRPDRGCFLREWAGPVAVVSGALDPTPGPQQGRALAARIAQGSFREVAGVGHYLPLEAPVELAAIVGGLIGGVRRDHPP